MSYFITKDDLDKVVDGIFTAIGKLFSEKDEELKVKLKALEANFLLLINTMGQQSHQSKKALKEQEDEKGAD